jgi:hypothetical protein
MAMSSRKTSRAQMATLLGQIATFVNVYDHQVKNFDGKSPVATVHSDGSKTAIPGLSAGVAPVSDHPLVETHGRRRHRGLHGRSGKRSVRQKIYDNVRSRAATGTTSSLTRSTATMDYVILDGTKCTGVR